MVFGVAAYVLWGLFPLYWPLLKPANAVEILAHRIMWSLVAVAAILAAGRNWAWIRTLDRRRLGLLALASVLISANWGTYIFAVNTGKTIEASLGYFINPLISILFGVVIFRERLRPWQWAAVGFGTAAVAVLTVDYGRLPYIALILATSFGVYGLLKKFADMPSAESLAVETTVMFVPALAASVVMQVNGSAAFGHHGPGNVALLAAAGIVTAVPLLLFNASAVRVPMSTLGLLQYLAPVLQFLIGLLVQHEAMPASRWAGFFLVWTALLILTADGLLTGRRTRRIARQAAGTPDPVAEPAA
ncbi:EamA family transporter RarD [Actinomadura rupiterrae]|uniref:EamA family transporter RarD n=1 Tax=Actinomadura rupiterrae TaxID=559627 RepID=UPI0020A3E220|nr:EamA family transporter RarD [Actinomadura rupiterrae]MCP2343434.1 chloramphenicol-sensitive protein RarD [Actinomadura rupiterrae]